MKYKEILEKYDKIKQLKKQQKEYETEREFNRINRRYYEDAASSFLTRLIYLFKPSTLLIHMSVYADFNHKEEMAFKDSIQLGLAISQLEKELRDNDLPVNGDIASAEGLVKAIHKMKKVK